MRRILTDTQHRYRSFEHAAWERAASCYADAFGLVTAPFAAALLDAVGCTSSTRLLDVASGTGYIAHLASQRHADVQAIDFSASMVAQARQRHPSVSFLQADAEALPYPDHAFDAVVIGFGLHHFPSPLAAAKEAHRVLRAGGKFAFTLWSASDNAFQQVLLDAVRESGKGRASLPPAPMGEINEPEHCLSFLREAGFGVSSAQVRRLRASIPVSSPERLYEITARSTARGAELLRSQPEQTVPAIIDSLRKTMSPYLRTVGEDYEVPAVALLASAIK